MTGRPYRDDEWRADLIDMTGQRHGKLRVLGLAGRRDYGPRGGNGPRVRVAMFRVRCDCGREFVTEGRRIRNEGVRQCVDCGRAASASYGRDVASVRLPDGRTLAQIAAATGLKLNTVYVRWMRGWEHWRLGEVTQRRRTAP